LNTFYYFSQISEWTPLFSAVIGGVDMVELLVNNGADVCHRSKLSLDTPRTYAGRRGFTKVEEILGEFEDPNRGNWYTLVDGKKNFI